MVWEPDLPVSPERLYYHGDFFHVHQLLFSFPVSVDILFKIQYLI